MSRSIAIIGGGIIGTCTAYYLKRHSNIGSTTIRIFEATAIASASSGKAGGFLASDWQGASTSSLAKLSFDLHEELAKEHDGPSNWGYRRAITLKVDVDANRRDQSIPEVDWLSSVTDFRVIGTPASTAQVTPRDFTRTIAKASGAEIIIATVTELHETADGTFEFISVSPSGERSSFAATDVVFAAGPWTGRLATKLLGEKAGVAADIVPSACSTSMILRPGQPLTALFVSTNLNMPNGTSGSPDFYSRPDGTIYMCGGGSSTNTPLPDTAEDVKPSEEKANKLREYAAFISPSHLGEEVATVEVAQACHRPDSSKTGVPIIGQFAKGLWIASGHQVWGISNGPGTGKVMAELMLDGKATSADISSLLPPTFKV